MPGLMHGMTAQKQQELSAQEQALAWVTRLRSPEAGLEDRTEFALWLAASTANSHAMDDALSLWDDLEAVKHLPFDDTANTQVAAANQSRWWLGAGVAAAAVLAAVLVLPLNQPSPTEPAQSYATELGQRDDVLLQDSSRISLNSDSQLSVSYTETTRDLTLERGEAYFEVAKDSTRPFTVSTNIVDVMAVGTAFNIDRREQTTEITVTEGVVRVTERRGGSAAESAILKAAQKITVNDQGLGAIESVAGAEDTAWRRGELVANGVPLHELAAELERYSATRIRFGDAEVAGLSVSGVFPLDETDTALQAIARSLELTIVPAGDNSVLLLNADH